MNNYSIQYRVMPVFVMSSFLFFAGGYTSTTNASPIQSQTATATAPLQLAYFRVYRAQPGWWRGPRPYVYVGPGNHRYVRGCKNSCYLNRYGEVLRCTKRCY